MATRKLKASARKTRGASLLGYGLIVGLIAVTAILAVTGTGSTLNNLFTQTSDSLSGVSTSTGASAASSPAAASLSAAPSTVSGMDISGGSSPGTPVVISISNPGGSVSGNLTVSLTGDTGSFNITADTCSGNTLSPGASCDVTVEPVATSNGGYAATVQAGDGSLSASSSLSGTASGFILASCKALFDSGTTSSGTYSIDPDGPGGDPSFTAYCNMADAGGGWTLCTFYDSADVTTIAAINGDWGDDPSARSGSGARACTELLAQSSTNEALVRTSGGSMIRFEGITSSFNNSYTSHEFVSWPGNLTGQSPVFSASGSQDHLFGMRDLDYNFGSTCGNYSPNYYQVSIDKGYQSNSGSCAPTFTINQIEFGIHDRENCNLCTCNWTSCWSGKSSPDVELYIR
ncbi:MAG: hypothetical protein Alpg2KO_16140 [Alphaproteobacteria bacterium]